MPSSKRNISFRNELNRISFYTMINSLTTSRYTSTLGFDDQSNFYTCIVPIPYPNANPSQTLIYFESISDIRASIINHFAVNPLTVVSVAEHFGISESMMRRVAKEATGTSFANYVTTLRFAQIKSRLAETNLPIKDIVEGAGYMDVSSYTRKFKATEGVTPGQYRAMLR